MGWGGGEEWGEAFLCHYDHGRATEERLCPKKNAAEGFLCCVLGFTSTVNSYIWSCLDGQFTYHTFSRQA